MKKYNAFLNLVSVFLVPAHPEYNMQVSPLPNEVGLIVKWQVFANSSIYHFQVLMPSLIQLKKTNNKNVTGIATYQYVVKYQKTSKIMACQCKECQQQEMGSNICTAQRCLCNIMRPELLVDSVFISRKSPFRQS